ncbi:MAG: LPP20 family lipoprotein [Deltaproteobacteria bacterium]|nr:LPP20 family lipoprotein [Deltaproteobacteria bacterium]
MKHRIGFTASLGIVLLGTGLCAAFSACGGGSAPPPRANAANDPNVPPWVDRVPDVKGKICALGSAEPTFFREDGKVYAAENARTQLASTLSLRVESVMIDIQSTNSGENYVDQQYVTQAQSFATDAVVQGAQVISYWYDETGTRGRQRATYALACLDTNSSVAELNNRLQQAYPQNEKTNQKIRERAKAAFDDLEKEEAKHAKNK